MFSLTHTHEKCVCDSGFVAAEHKALPNIDALGHEELKALVLAQRAQLLSRDTEIEHLKLLIFKLKRMQFGQKSEKLNRQIGQLELRLEDLEANQASSTPVAPPTALLTGISPVKPVRRPLPAELPRETGTRAPREESCPGCGGTLRLLGEDVCETLEYIPSSFKVIRTVRLS